MERFDPKAPEESLVLTFDLSDGLAPGESLTGTPTVSIEVSTGTDPNPNSVLNGPPAIDTSLTQVLQAVTGGVDRTDYILRATCATTNALKILSWSAILPVREFISPDCQ